MPQLSHQDASPVEDGTESAEKPGNRFIPGSVVTAQKREENLQDVPISVSAFSGDNLEARGVDDPKALEKITPGLSYSGFVGYSIIYLRGVGTDVFIPSADTSVATYIDGVYLPFAHALAQSFVKLERIEVLKVRKALCSAATPPAARSISSPRSPATSSGPVSMSAAALQFHQHPEFVTGPILDTLKGSLSVIYDKSDPYSKLTAIRAFDPWTRTSPVGSTPSSPGHRWTTSASARNVLATDFDGTFTVPSASEQTTPLGKLLGIKPVGHYQYGESYRNFVIAHNVLVYGQTAWTPKWFDMKLLGSYQKVKTDTMYDYDSDVTSRRSDGR